jgi:hypothetical protein
MSPDSAHSRYNWRICLILWRFIEIIPDVPNLALAMYLIGHR